MKQTRLPALALIAAIPMASWAQNANRPAYLLKGARVVVAPGKVLDKADILVKDGLIAKVGSNIDLPAGAEQIDCSGLSVYPGLIHPLMRVTIDGLSPTPPATGTGTPGGAGGGQRNTTNRDNDPFGKQTNLLAHQKIAELGQKGIADFKSYSESGYGIANVYGRGGLVGAQSGIFSLSSGDVSKDSFIKDGIGFPISFGGFRGGYPGSTMGAIAFIRQTLLDAGWYSRLMSRASGGGSAPEKDLALERLGSLTRGETSLLYDDSTETSALEGMSIAREMNMKAVYSMRRGTGAIIDLLKNPNVTVLLESDLPTKPLINANNDRNDISSIRGYFNDLQAASELEKAGVEFCYEPTSSSSPFEGIRLMVRSGLSRDAALASMTTRPAKLLGLSAKAGTIEEGKLGNLLVVQGDLFDSSSQVMASFVDGKRVDFKMPERKKVEDMKADQPLRLLPVNYDNFPRPAENTPAFRMYKNATIWTMSKAGVIQGGDIIIKDGKIVAVGKGLTAPAGCQVIDAKGFHITPGIWDCHSHTAVVGSVNEGSNMITCECRIQDVVNHRDVDIYRQLAGGVVGAQQLHGSANVIGGQTNPVKWRWGQRPDDFRVKNAPMGVKFALGQNPIREPSNNFGATQTPEPSWNSLLTWRPQTRMGNEDSIRRAFYKGKEYAQTWADYRAGKIKTEPRRDIQLEALSQIADGTIRIHSHGYRQDEFLTLMRVAKEVGAHIATFQHILEGYKIADEMAADGIGGSTFADWWGFKLEAYDAIPYNMSLMAERGVTVSVNSDSDNHARRLYVEAAKAMRYGGANDVQALSFVTTGPTKQMGIDQWTGSLDAGKDADIVVWSAPPTSMYTKCLETYVDGVKLFDLADDAKQRAERDAYLSEVKKVLGESEVLSTEIALTSGDAAKVMGIGEVTGNAGLAKYSIKGFAIVGATVHPMVGEPFVGNVVVGEDGLIKAAGPKVSVPGGMNRIDGKGKHVYPGLIDASTTLGLNEIGQVPVSDDTSERGNFHPDYRPERAVNPESELLGVARAQGVLTAVTHPTGSGMPGQAALIHLEGYTWEDMTIQSGVAVMLTVGGGGGFGFGEDEDLCGEEHFGKGSGAHTHDEHEFDTSGQGRRGGDGGDSSSSLRQASEWLKQAREYKKSRDAYTAGTGPLIPRDDRMEALLKVIDRKMSVLAAANTAADMKSAVEWAEKENVTIQLLGCTSALEIADWLAQRQIPVIFTATLNMPSTNDAHPHQFYQTPGKLKAAGVKVALSTNSDFDVRQLREHAGFAAAYGMNREDALRSITLWPAEILGLGKRLGAVQAGYEGTLILTDGDLLETATQVVRAWIRGKESSLENKQTRLYNKYNNKPKPNTWKKAG